MDIMRQSACLVVNLITVYSYGFLFHCTTVGQASDSTTVLTKAQSFHLLVGSLCLSLAKPTVAQLEVFFMSCESFSLFHHSVFIWLY